MLTNELFRRADRREWLFRSAILTGCLVLPHAIAAETILCSDANAEVSAQTNEVCKEVCTAAKLTIGFLAGYGLKTTRPVRVSVVEQTIYSDSYSAYGSYDSRSDLVQIMSPQAITQTMSAPSVNQQPLDSIQYRSIVVHEVAHALIQQNNQVLPLPLGQAAQEYLACVTQLSIMPSALRDEMIRKADVGAWESGDVISSVYMAISPERFAVKSYLHFQRQPEPGKFVDKLLKSKSRYLNVE
ncbi:MAG: hypothetical protein H6963_07050 [Chromatiaceae bacterium]|nr:hypothetical protein [Chromatiaceae bacterium]MCP5409033.1 hypothetical protein [Chromatiaceae bacterium]MCP5441924.1 hypothetical protein [Chromatiaceae bacterium]